MGRFSLMSKSKYYNKNFVDMKFNNIIKTACLQVPIIIKGFIKEENLIDDAYFITVLDDATYKINGLFESAIEMFVEAQNVLKDSEEDLLYDLIVIFKECIVKILIDESSLAAVKSAARLKLESMSDKMKLMR